MTRAVRGAIQVRENSVGSIEDAAVKLVHRVLLVNAIAENDIVSIIFSLTDDLHAANPAGAVRRAGFVSTPLFCTQEAKVDGGLPRIIRALVTFEREAALPPVPVYMDGAEALRPDIAGEGRP